MNELTYQQHAGAQADISVKDIFASIARRKWVIVLTTVVCVAVATTLSMLQARNWTANAQMLLTQRAMGSSAKPFGSTAALEAYGTPVMESIDTQMGLIQSDGMYERTMQWLNNDAMSKGQTPLAMSQLDFDKAVTVTSPKMSNLVNVAVQTDDRQTSLTLANAICQAFVKWKVELARKDIDSVRNNLVAQTRHAQAALQQAERRRLAYQKAHHLVDVPAQEKSLMSQLEARNADIAAINQELSSQEAKLKALEAQLQQADRAIKNGNGVRDDALVLALQTQLNQLEIDRADLAQKVTPQYPGMLPQMDKKIADVKQRLAQAIQGTLDNNRPSLQSQGVLYDTYKQTQVTASFIRARLAAATNLRDQVQRQLAPFPQAGLEMARLQRAEDLAAAQYTSLQAVLNAAQMDAGKIPGNVQITQGAFVPEENLLRKRISHILLGLIAGLFLSGLAVLLMEQYDRRIRSLDDVRRLISGQIIGVLPQLSRRQIQAVAQGNLLESVQEAASLARVNLSLVMHKAAQQGAGLQQTILVTSALPGEGKTTVAAQMARSAAQVGCRTILVDANLRRPAQERFFPTEEEKGLAEVLRGEISLDEALVPTDMDHLWVLHSGAGKYNSTDLLSQSSLTATFNALREKADAIIIDAPDCVSVADTLLLAAQADCLLQVIGINRVDEDLMVETAEALASTEKTTVFMVNRTPKPKKRSYRNVSVLPSFQSLNNTRMLNRSGLPAFERPVELNGLNGSRDLVFVKPPAPAEKD